MKSITFFRYSIIAFSILMLLGITANLVLSFNGSIALDKQTALIFGLLSLLFVSGLFYVQKTLLHFSNNRFFTQHSISSLQTSGYLFILFSLSSSVYNGFYYQSTETLITNFVLYIIVLLIGIGIVTFSNILKEGKKLKQENELTI